ncbi:MAG: hypothetical protein ACKODC_00940, partial [Limnohabitans sp.]
MCTTGVQPVRKPSLLWPPALESLAPDWRETVRVFLESPQGQALSLRIQAALANGSRVYPDHPLRALSLTAAADVRVVILGQDPYHRPGQAEGLAFSVASGQPQPPSLRNIFKELRRSLRVPPAKDGSLLRWARQGVLQSMKTTGRGCAATQPTSESVRVSQPHWAWLPARPSSTVRQVLS